MIYCNIIGQRLNVTAPVVASDSIHFVALHFAFTGEAWATEGLRKFAIFKDENGQQSEVEIDDDNEIKQTAGVSFSAGTWTISVIGCLFDADTQTTTTRITTNTVTLEVDDSGVGTEPFPEWSGSVGEQALQQAEAYADAAAASAEEAQAAAEYITVDTSPNVFDKSAATQGKAMVGTDIIDSANGYLSDYIKLTTGDQITFRASSNSGLSNVGGWYKADKTIIRKLSTQDGYGVQNLGGGLLRIAFNGTGERYARINGDLANINTDMIVMNEDYPDTYLPYGTSVNLSPDVQVSKDSLPKDMVLGGKKAAFIGDSICYGAGYAGGYPSLIGDKYGMTVSNTGRTGATLATGTKADGVNRFWICNGVANMPSGYDYYIVEGGVNDIALSVSLGTMTSGYTDTLDTTTALGALETICKTLQTTFAGKKYGFVFTHKCYANTNSYITTWVPAMKAVLKKWGIPYLDLGEKTAQLNNIDALRTYTLNGDGWHPTEDGYKLFYIDKIAAWMATL